MTRPRLRSTTRAIGTATLIAVLVAATVMLVAATVGTGAAQEKSRLNVVLERGKLIVAILVGSPPYGFRDEKGELVGFDLDLARLFAKALFNDPNKVEFVSVDGSGRWPAVTSGRADFGMNTSVYPDRAVRVTFTRPYVDSSIGILVRKDAGIKSLADLNNEKFTVANFSNPQMEERAKRFFPKAKLAVFEGVAAQFLAVRTGRAQAMQQETGMISYLAAQNKDLAEVLAETVSESNNVAIYLKQGDFAWWSFLDITVAELRYGSWHPQYAEIYQKWFGKSPPRSH
jgi:polar amino acid transport system substrate-binding protein